MKRYVPFFLLLTLILSACTIRSDVDLVVEEDESGTFVVFVGLDEQLQELAAQFSGEPLDLADQFGEVPENWTMEDVTDDGFEGVRLSTGFDSFDDLEAKISGLGAAGAGFGADALTGFELTREGDEFRFSVDVSGVDDGLMGALGESGGADLLEGFDANSLGELFEVNFRLTLPGSIVEHNADSISGNTLTWNLDVAASEGTLEAVSDISGGSSALLLGGVAVAALVVAGVGVTAVRRRKEAREVSAVSGALHD